VQVLTDHVYGESFCGGRVFDDEFPSLLFFLSVRCIADDH
jgi:hypothetical protein